MCSGRSRLRSMDKYKEVSRMIEVDMRWDFLPGMDQEAYQAWAKKAIGTVLKSPGLVEFRAGRSMLAGPMVRVTTVWKTMADWANFDESEAWQALREEILDQYAQNISVEIWGPSPVVPEPLRPG
jgi:heme-degrading monooxygenase HmoA